MNSNDLPNILAESVGYTPYSYESGLFLQHGSTHEFGSTYRSSHPEGPNYGRPFTPWDEPQTIEQIIAHGYLSVPPGDPITAIISDRQHVSRLGLDDVITQIRRRYTLHDDIIERIDRAKCAAANAIYEHEAYVGPPSAQQMHAKHQSTQDLYGQQRKEQIDLWRDVSRLRQALPENAQAYLSAYRKISSLSDIGGDGQ